MGTTFHYRSLAGLGMTSNKDIKQTDHRSLRGAGQLGEAVVHSPLHCGFSMRLWQRLQDSELVRHTSVSVVDQALNSAANFAVGLLLIRTIPTAEYGTFVLANTALYLAIGVENSLVTAPMSVMAPKLVGAAKYAFVDALALGQLVVWLPLLLLSCLVVSILSAAGVLDAAGLRLALLTACVVVPFVAREFVRQALFIFAAPVAVFVADAVYAATMLAAIVVVTRSSSPGLYAVAAIGVAAVVAAAVGGVVYVRLAGAPTRLDLQPLKQTWRLASWGLLGMSVSWAQHQGFLYLLAAVQGSEAVGHVSAARLLLMPIALVITGVGTILRPRCAAWLASGEARKAMSRLLALTLATAIGSLVYVLALWLGRDLIIGTLMRKPLGSLDTLILVWAAVLLIEVFRENFMILLQALERFDQLFFLALAGGLSALGGGYLLLQRWGAPGAVAGVALGEAVYLLGICMALQRTPALR